MATQVEQCQLDEYRRQMALASNLNTECRRRDEDAITSSVRTTTTTARATTVNLSLPASIAPTFSVYDEVFSQRNVTRILSYSQ